METTLFSIISETLKKNMGKLMKKHIKKIRHVEQMTRKRKLENPTYKQEKNYTCNEVHLEIGHEVLVHVCGGGRHEDIFGLTLPHPSQK